MSADVNERVELLLAGEFSLCDFFCFCSIYSLVECELAFVGAVVSVCFCLSVSSVCLVVTVLYVDVLVGLWCRFVVAGRLS